VVWFVAAILSAVFGVGSLVWGLVRWFLSRRKPIEETIADNGTTQRFSPLLFIALGVGMIGIAALLGFLGLYAYCVTPTDVC